MPSIASHLLRNRWVYFIVSFLLCLSLASGMQYLKKETGYRIFFPDNSPRLASIDERNDEFSTVDTIVFAIEALNDSTLKDPKSLSAIYQLTTLAWQIPHSTRVDSLANFQASTVDGDDLLIQDLIPDIEDLSQERISHIVSQVNKEPSAKGFLVNEQWTGTFVEASLRLPLDLADRIVSRNEAVKYARSIAQEIESQHPNIKAHLIGQSVVNTEFEVLADRDTNTLGPIMLLLSAVIMFFISRSFYVTLSTLLVVVLATLATNGFMAFAGYNLNQVTSGVGTIIMAIGICNCVHILDKYQTLLTNSENNIDAFIDAIHQTAVPVVIANLTTCIGFLSLNFSSVPPFRDFANISTFGIILSMFLSFTLFPALSVLGKVKHSNSSQSTFWDRLHNFVFSNQKSLMIGCSALFVFACYFALQNEVNDDAYGYFDENLPISQGAQFAEDHLSGTKTVSYTLDTGHSDGITNPEYIKKIEGFVNFLETQNDVAHVTSYTSILKRLQRDMNGGNPEQYLLPTSKELASQYLLMYELSLPYGTDLTNLVNFDKSKTLVTAYVKDADSNKLIALDNAAYNWMDTNAPTIGVDPNSPTALFFYVGIDNVKSMLIGSLVALFLVAICLSFALKSVKFGLLSLIPNAFPAILTIGLWGFYNGQADIAIATIFAITLGIVIDDTVHLTHHYFQGLKQGHSPEKSILYAYKNVGKALLYTTLILSTGFFVLATSDFKVNANLGLLVGLTIIFALILDLVFYAPLLKRFTSNKVPPNSTKDL